MTSYDHAKHIDLSNEDFVRSIIGNQKSGTNIWVTGFVENPHTAQGQFWRGKKANPDSLPLLREDHNTYISIALLSGNRKKENFKRLMAMVIDDGNPDHINQEPSWILETSPDNYQIGFILRNSEETRDAGLCTKAHNLLAKAGLVSQDPSGNNPVRYVRLPVGSNTKDTERGPFRVRLTKWNPNFKFSLSDVLESVGINSSLLYEAVGNSVQDKEDRGGRLDVVQSFCEIVSGDVLHDNILRLSAHYAAVGLSFHETEKLIRGLLESSEDKGSDRWKSRLDDLSRVISSGYDKFYQATEAVEPLNLLGVSSDMTSAWFPDDYPSVIADLSSDIAERMGVDEAIPVWTAITAAGALIHDNHQIQIKRNDCGWCESPRVWSSIVGPPSTKKTPGQKEVLKPIFQIQSEWYKEYQAQLAQYEIDSTKPKEKQQALKKPSLRKLVVTDATIEAVSNICNENPGGILSVYDELAGYFGSMDAYRGKGISKDRPFWLSSYNGGPFFIDRARANGSTHIENLSVSICGGIQPAPMRRIASKLEDDGLLQRFVHIYARDAEFGKDKSPNVIAQSRWKDVVHVLSDVIPNNKLTIYRLNDDAQRIMDEQRDRIHSLGKNPGYDPRLQTALQKSEGQLARIVLIFHFLEEVTRTASDDDLCLSGVDEKISYTTVQKAINVFDRVLLPNMVRFYHELIGDTSEQENARWIAGYIATHIMDTVTERDIYRAKSSLRKDKNAIQSAMTQLSLAGWVNPKQQKLGSNPSSWSINQRIYIDFKSQIAKERKRRERVKEQIARTSAALSNKKSTESA